MNGMFSGQMVCGTGNGTFRVHSLKSEKVSIQIQLKTSSELSEWTLTLFRLGCFGKIWTPCVSPLFVVQSPPNLA